MKYDFIIGNPPYVPITGLTPSERASYRKAGYASASGRMDLYMLFFEASLRRLATGGRLVLVTPEKYLYVKSGAALRKLLRQTTVEQVEFMPEGTFPGLTTYPVVTTLTNQPSDGPTEFTLRDGRTVRTSLPPDGSSWLPAALGFAAKASGPTLGDVSLRISPGIATGADRIFVVQNKFLPSRLSPHAYPTISGRQLRPGSPLPDPSDSMLVPYSPDGRLQNPTEAGPLYTYLSEQERRAQLSARTCAQRKPWYAFHDSAPLSEIQRPKILCKDITAEPQFWVDREGSIVPRHTVYYIVPKDTVILERLAAYLNSEEAKKWLMAHCQRAANGFIRLQSTVIREMPVAAEVVPVRVGRKAAQTRLVSSEAS